MPKGEIMINGHTLRQLRDKQEMSQAQFGKKLGIGPHYVAKLEQFEQRPVTKTTALKLLEATGGDASFIVGEINTTGVKAVAQPGKKPGKKPRRLIGKILVSGKQLKECRYAADMTVQALADKAQVRFWYLRKIELQKQPSYTDRAKAMRVSQALGTTAFFVEESPLQVQPAPAAARNTKPAKPAIDDGPQIVLTSSLCEVARNKSWLFALAEQLQMAWDRLSSGAGQTEPPGGWVKFHQRIEPYLEAV